MVIDIPRMIDYIKKHKNVFLFSGSLLLAAVLIAVLVIFSGPAKKASNTSLPASNINPAANEIAYSTLDEAHTAYEEPRESTVNNAATERDRATEVATEALTTAPATTQAAQQGDVVFATAEVPDSPAESYSTYHIDLTDSDRQLLENLCYGEFGTGGFIGAALIAQAVKDAMCFDGYTTIPEVIRECRYDGSTTRGTSEECRQAVRYVFDDDGSAVQHRILYMYAPYLVNSSFHESQNFILSYQQIRFFDRWGA